MWPLLWMSCGLVAPVIDGGYLDACLTHHIYNLVPCFGHDDLIEEVESCIAIMNAQVEHVSLSQVLESIEFSQMSQVTC